MFRSKDLVQYDVPGPYGYGKTSSLDSSGYHIPDSFFKKFPIPK